MILLATPLCNYGRGFCLIDVGTEGQEAEIAHFGAVYRKKPSTLLELELAAEIIAICKSSSNAKSLSAQ